METTSQEKLIQFIHSLTNAECEMIVSFLMQENYTLGEADCSAPIGGMVFDSNPGNE